MSDQKTQFQPSQNDPLEQLKSLLFKEDKQRVKELTQQIGALQQEINQKDRLIEKIEPIIVELLDRKIQNSREEMAKALAPAISLAIKHQIRDAKEDVVDALYPILGRMVTKAVTEAMRKLADQINTTLEKSFSWELWKKRFKAKALGVDAGKMILAESAPFELDSAFLISKDSGLLIAFANRETDEAAAANPQVVGGMLTAIKSFVETSFAANKEGDLEEIRLTDCQIRIQSGRYSYLAVVYRGIPSTEFDELLNECHRAIHQKYHQKLRNYDGNSAALRGIDMPLKKIIKKMQTVEHE